MKKILVVTLLLVFLLAACSGAKTTTAVVSPIENAVPTAVKIKATIANDDGARITQALVEKWISAYQKHDANLLLSLWSDTITWKICASGCSAYHMDELRGYVSSDLSRTSFTMNTLSYTVLNTGTFAVVQAIYQDASASGDAKDPTPATVILQFLNGKIVNETWYYITTP